MYIWIFICMFFGNIYIVYITMGMVTLDINDIWYVEFDSIFDIEYD
jgi:hypothetical protein